MCENISTYGPKYKYHMTITMGKILAMTCWS
jgi:hypothetical protein